MRPPLRIVVVQQDFPVGDVDGNVKRVADAIRAAAVQRPDLLVFPELTISGYPPEDLLYRGGFMRRCESALAKIVQCVAGIEILLGHPLRQNDNLFNAVSWIRNREIIGQYCKRELPNYAVFDEKRYFEAGTCPLTVEVAGTRVGVLICEDIWEPEPARHAAADGCQIIVVPNASPFHLTKRAMREQAVAARARETGLPIVYGNLIGGQDELVFDGRSFAVTAVGDILGPTPLDRDGLFAFDFDSESGQIAAFEWQPDEVEDATQAIYRTLVRGTRDYARKNGFTDVVIGLSGGIDSALTLAIGVDALGAKHVHAVMLPSRHTSRLSLDLAAEQARMLGVELIEISIEPAYRAMLESVQSTLPEKKSKDLTEQNLQARCRGNLLMALSNQHGWMVLATGNKSEIAVGYCTIYGDMCGGFAPIKDCVKTLVYQLSNYRNNLSAAIPQGVIDRPPSAELAAGQTDQDALPPYDILDRILALYVEADRSVDEIVAQGFDENTVREVVRLVRINEYKRRQSAPGVRVTPRAFGRDRRYPIANGWRF